jgi:hypothetical protein
MVVQALICLVIRELGEQRALSRANHAFGQSCAEPCFWVLELPYCKLELSYCKLDLHIGSPMLTRLLNTLAWNIVHASSYVECQGTP